MAPVLAPIAKTGLHPQRSQRRDMSRSGNRDQGIIDSFVKPGDPLAGLRSHAPTFRFLIRS